MRRFMAMAVFALGIVIACAGDASAWWRRSRGQCCCVCQPDPCWTSPCYPAPNGGPVSGKPPMAPDKRMCSCSGTRNSCSVDCKDSCYALQDKDGYCHCDCVDATTNVPYFPTPAEAVISLRCSQLKLGDLDRLLGLRKVHQANIQNPDQRVSLEMKGTIADLMKQLKIAP